MRFATFFLTCTILSVFSLQLSTQTTLAQAATETKGTKDVSVGGLTFKVSDDWESKPARPMTQAILSIKPKGINQSLDVVFYFFGSGQGGSPPDNIARWKKQFDGEPKGGSEEVTVGDELLRFVDFKGTYLDGIPMGPKTPKANYALLGAIVPGTDGPVFLKMTGPEATVAAAKEAFKALATSPFKK